MTTIYAASIKFNTSVAHITKVLDEIAEEWAAAGMTTQVTGDFLEIDPDALLELAERV